LRIDVIGPALDVVVSALMLALSFRAVWCTRRWGRRECLAFLRDLGITAGG
jgi:hypothetical protein